MKLHRFANIVCALLVASAPVCLARAPKVIIDTDFNTIGDDGQVGAMAAQLYAQGVIDLLGFTVPSGNQWRDQEVADCLKAVERMGIENRVKVYVGSQYPLLHNYQAYLYEQLLFGNAIDYVGAYETPQPDPNHLVPPPDGFAVHTRPDKADAVDFIIQSVHRYPNEISILAIGPLTNIAIAIRKDPSIIPLIRQIVFMGGQVYAPGNAYNDAGEFNWWFDPEAVQAVLRADVPKFIVPLDCTNTVPLTKETYLQIANHQPSTIVTELYKDSFAPFFGSAPPPYVPYIYDTIALGFLVNPSFATDIRDIWLDIDTVTPSANTTFGSNYGKTTPYTSDPYPSIGVLSKSKVVFTVDTSAFLKFYVDLLTRPVPVKFQHAKE
jgi:inosine-uridine nucleoside N-ribohydrolase